MLSSREANAEYSFGFHRAEVLGAVASIFVIWIMTGILLWEAVLRLITPVSCVHSFTPPRLQRVVLAPAS